MTKNQVISELLSNCVDALDAQLTEETYSEFLKGSVTFRIDLIRKPQTIFARVALPGKNDPKLKVKFMRRYTRLVDRLNAIEK